MGCSTGLTRLSVFSRGSTYSITLPVYPVALKESMLTVTACLLGCGIESDKCLATVTQSFPWTVELHFVDHDNDEQTIGSSSVSGQVSGNERDSCNFLCVSCSSSYRYPLVQVQR